MVEKKVSVIFDVFLNNKSFMTNLRLQQKEFQKGFDAYKKPSLYTGYDAGLKDQAKGQAVLNRQVQKGISNSKQMESQANNYIKNTEKSNLLGIQSTGGYQGYNASLKDQAEGHKENSSKIKNSAQQMKLLTKEEERAAREAKRFKFEYLGIMFAGMALQQTFSNLSQGAMEWMGVTDLMGTGMNVLMLESLMPFSETLYGMGESLFTIAEGTDASSVALRSLLGVSAIAGQGLGIFMQGFGQIALLLATLTAAFPTLAAVTGPAIGGLMATFGVLLGTTEDTDPVLRTIGSSIASVGAALVASPIAEAASEVSILGVNATSAAGDLITLAAAGTAFYASGGIGNVLDLLGLSTIKTNDEIKGLSGSINGLPNPGTIYLDLGGNLTASVNGNVATITNRLDGKQYTVELNATGDMKSTLTSILSALEQLNLIKTPEQKQEIANKQGYNVSTSLTGEDTLTEITRTPTTIYTGISYANTPLGQARSYLETGKTINPFTGKTYAHGGIIPGNPGQPVPIIAHGGERFLGTNSSGTGEITVSPTYNIYVNDRSEIEQMLRRNNENLVNEVKRLSFGG